MSRDRTEGGRQDDLYSLISSTTDLFTSLDVTDSVTDLTTSDSSHKTSTLTQTLNSRRTDKYLIGTEQVTKSERKTTEEDDDERGRDKHSLYCDEKPRQILSARELHKLNYVKMSTDV